MHAQEHRVGGRPIDAHHPVRDRVHPEWPVERERVARRALLPVGRDDRDGAERGQRFGQRADPIRLDPVVVRDEDVDHFPTWRSTRRMNRIVSRNGWM